MCEHEEVTRVWPAEPQFTVKQPLLHMQPPEQVAVVQEQPTDAEELQSDELEVLESILGDDFIQVASKDSHNKNNNNNNSNNNNSLIFIARSQQLSTVAPEYFLTVEIRLPDLYPHCLPTITSITSNCGVLSNSMEDDLYLALATHANSLLGEPMIYDLFTLTCDFLCNKIITRDVPMLNSSSLEFNQTRGKILEQALCPDLVIRRERDRVEAEAAAIEARSAELVELLPEGLSLEDFEDFLQSFGENSFCGNGEETWVEYISRMEMYKVKKQAMAEGAGAMEHWEEWEEYTNRLELYRAEQRAAAEAEKAAAMDYENKNTLSVQHLMLNRPTFRAAHNWVGTMASIFAHIPDIVAVLKIEVILNTFLCQEFQKYSKAASREVVFHGTSAANVDSIVKNGMWTDVGVANGRAYGDGVYVSKFPEVSKSYTCGMGYIFVCAAVDVKWHFENHSIGTVRDNTMLLPCYLLRVKQYQRNSNQIHQPGTMGSGQSSIKATPSGFLYAQKQGAHTTAAQEEQMSNAHQMAIVAKEAAIKNASFYLDTKRFKVLDVAVIDEDDDGTTYDAANSMQPLRMSAQSGSVSVYDITHEMTFQAGRHVAPMRSKAQHDKLAKKAKEEKARYKKCKK